MVDATSLSLDFFVTRPGIRYLVETSTDLQNRTSVGVTWSEPDQSGLRTTSVGRDGPQRFLRLRISESPER
jgi:hypothetical protein